jgi:signal transduction histidine kinase/CheY-like chemotaxis protein/sensor domain CHASE-containing protein
MKTKRRLQVILFSCIILFFIAAFVLERVVSNKLQVLLEARLANVVNQTDKIIFIHNASVKGYLEENSYWDELCIAIQKKDTGWISSSMAEALKTPLYGANMLCVLDEKGSYVYNSIFNANKYNTSENNIPSSFMLDVLGANSSKTFCYKNGAVYIEGFISFVVPGSDFAKKTKPKGFLLVGKIVDESYLKQLKEINTDFEYSFVQPSNNFTKPKDFVNKETGELTCYKKISCLNGPSVIIKITNYLPETKIYINFLRIALFIYLLFVGIIIIALYRYFFRYFFKPLEKITVALEENKSLAISNVITKNTELGKVAKMIDQSFKQTEIFQKEIDNRIRTEAELKWAINQIEIATIEKVRAEQSADAKSEFLATMSHEIRTPINGVIGVANLLKDEKLTPRQKEYVDILSYSSKHLLALVSDILDFSKIETGKVEFESTSFDLNAICNAVFKIFKISADAKKLSLVYLPDTTVINSVYGDSVRINQILTNLVGNAIKFTSDGIVSFGYKLLSKTTNNCTIEFFVTDTGIGIADDEQGKIFDGFSQANKKISSSFGGTGLGLAISKKLIELQGGKLDMKSKLGVGTTFTFYLSFETHVYDNILPNTTGSTFSVKKDLTGMKVLVAEDNNINVLVLKRFLEKWGIYYRVASNGQNALEIIDKEDFDLVLMDIHMPEMDGEEATKIIRQHENEKIKKIPIIALTANASVDTQQKLLSNGFNNYISKPFNPENLFRVLNKYYNL